jgi:hypothetical protein
MKPLSLTLASGHQITVAVEAVTPEQAAAWLKHNNLKNRKPRPRQIEILRREMAAGAWAFTHQGIAFGEAGPDGVEPLLDGQHRLLAIAASGLTLPDVLIFRRLPVKAQEATDMGQARSVAENLSLFDGEVNANALCALVNSAAQTWANYDFKVSLPQTREILKLFPKFRLFAKMDHSKYPQPFGLTPVKAACGIALHQWPAEAAAFWDAYQRGLGLHETHPAWHLRNHCLTVNASNFKTRSGLFSYAADCLDYHLTGRPMATAKATATGTAWLRKELSAKYTALKNILRLS